jgi:hypothetical protein
MTFDRNFGNNLLSGTIPAPICQLPLMQQAGKLVSLSILLDSDIFLDN